ncbi:DUF1330 domain-containing protein [Novosphingobium sp. PP1Y]|uniref:DUF1330 domain-containing protein n=1 Tax=Novosphingobium sp. PP1Y TaxID=702113 RepID=UPI00020EEB3B|nr:DUF1330 domain-containing protein [Novosphingobium sp. PP1Y]CCA92164.1 conserved hypothetical protein [Novosphingobium sp. PP1Y]
MPLYLLGAVSIADEEKYRPYMDGAFASLVSYGIEVLAYGDPEMIEGQPPAERMILLRASDEAAARAWYGSPEYQSVLPIRWAQAETAFFISMAAVE